MWSVTQSVRSSLDEQSVSHSLTSPTDARDVDGVRTALGTEVHVSWEAVDEPLREAIDELCADDAASGAADATEPILKLLLGARCCSYKTKLRRNSDGAHPQAAARCALPDRTTTTKSSSSSIIRRRRRIGFHFCYCCCYY